ncbi:MAG: TIGR01777 family oxidoreductase [Bacteroidia bacterium]
MKYLISGGSGMIGKRLGDLLNHSGNEICLLSRKPGFSEKFYKYQWNHSEKDLGWLKKTDVVFNLAGTSIASHKWTKDFKKKIYDSRIKYTRSLYEALKNNEHTITTFISASAIGIYGNQTFGIADENSPVADDFLASVCRDWELEAQKISELGIRVVIIRTGIVLAEKGGFLEKISPPVKYFSGTILGNGNQMTSWIHIDDLCRIFMKADHDHSMQGIFNAAAPGPVDHKTMVKKIAARLHKPLLLPNVPGFMLKYFLGEMSEMILADQNISSKKIMDAGFRFQFPDIDSALENLVK